MKSSMALMLLFIILVAGRVCCNDTTGSVPQRDCAVRRLQDHTFLRTLIVHCSVLCFLVGGEYTL